MSLIVTLPPIHKFEKMLKQHHSDPYKILIFLHYLMERKNQQAEQEDQSLIIYKILKKIILQRSCLDSLKGVATFLMGMVMIGHIHIYQKFNKFVLPGLITLYQQNKDILQNNQEKILYLESRINQKDSILEYIEQNGKSLQNWIAHFSKWLPKDFYKVSYPSIYIKIAKQNNIKDLTKGRLSRKCMITYNRQLLQKIEAFIQKMNIGSQNYCNLCWKYQVMNSKQDNRSDLDSLYQTRLQTKASQKIEQYKIKKSIRQNLYKSRINKLRKQLRQKDKLRRQSTSSSRSSRNIQTRHSFKDFKNIIPPAMGYQNKSNHDKFHVTCFFNCSQFEKLSSQKQTIFKKYLIKKNNAFFGPSLRQIIGFQIVQKIHKGIIKLKFRDSQELPHLLQPKNLLQKFNVQEKYFLINFQQKVAKIIFEFPNKQKYIYPFGYLKLLQNCQVNEWQAAKNTLRNQSFILNQQICPDIQTIVRRLDLKQVQCRYNNQKVYESFFQICKKIIKLTMKIENKKVHNKLIMMQGWCDQNIQSIMVLDQLLSQIKFCYGKN